MRTIIGLAALARSGKDTVASILLTYPGVAAFALADPLKVGCQALFGLTDEETWRDDLKEKTIELWGHSPREFFQTVGTEWMRHHNADHWLMRADREINPPAGTKNPPFPANLASPDAPFALAAQAFFDFTNDQVWNSASATIRDEAWGLAPREAIELLKRHAYEMFPDYGLKRAARQTTLLKPRGQVPRAAKTIIVKDIRFENEAAFLRAHHGEIWHITRPNLLKVNAHSSEHGINQAPEDILLENNGSLEDLKALVQHSWDEYTVRIAHTQGINEGGAK
ncbi:deoxynucleotide monophosphate kinase family protein [Stutzerimonas nitrititolerans]|uniref:deoxynucleotide monophosphate kinase family protein n=1 Tax=Stutzerimonas nitrititolerans TaxID=2482751 RepID=UPI002899E4EC|nr:deoxynucleotide monophosphate kinase [Stutzerimonas nitrititolerans]